MAPHSSPLLHRPGAVDAAEGTPDHGVPLHYGDPLGEQRAAGRGPIVVDRSNRDVLVLTGPERLSWLDGFVSQQVSTLRPGHATEFLVLDANGRVEHHAGAAETGEELVVDTEPGRGTDLAGFLRKMVFWAKVEIVGGEVTTGDTGAGDAGAGDAGTGGETAASYGILTLAGTDLPGSLTAPDGTTAELPADAFAVVALPGGGWARRLPWPEAGSVDLIVPRESITGWFDAAVAGGARPAGSWALEALRVADSPAPGRGPRGRIGVDTDEKAIPHEVPAWIGASELGGAVHLDKGCYRGQETVARVHNLGKSPRVLVRLSLDGSGDNLPEPGDEVTGGGRVVGRVGTVVHHFEEGPIALALVKRAVGPDAELLAGGVAAKIDPASAAAESGPQAGREAVRRLRGL